MMTKKQTAFLEAYERCHEPFIRYCSALAYGKMDMEDLVQDVLLSTFHHFEQIKQKGDLLHYMIRAARNRSISVWRKKRFHTELLEKHSERLLAKDVAPDVLMDIQLLYLTLDKLPEKQRHALILFEISGFSMKEIAEIQQSTEGAIKTKISRGRKKMRELLGDQPSHSVSALLRNAKTILL